MATISQENFRILMLPEDSAEGRDAIDHLQRFDGVTLKVIDSVDSAMELIRHHDWDAVISGVKLTGGGQGLDFLRDIRRFDQIFPFFFYTAESSPSVISSAFQAGANDYFVADGSVKQFSMVMDAVKISAEISSLLRDKMGGQPRSLFEEKYEMLFDELREGSMIISAEDGSITYANESMAGAIGMEPDELIGKPVDPLLAERKGAVSNWEEMRSQAADGSAVVQMNFRHAAGSVKSFWTQVRYLNLSGKPVLLCQCRDVTRLEQLEQEISTIRNQLKVIVENSADAIVLAREDGRIEFIGGAAPKMFGISEKDVTVNQMDDIFGPQSAHIRRAMRQMGGRSRVSGIESQIVSRWGTNVPVSVAITRLPSSDKITRYLFNIMDITAQKVIEAEKLMITELVGIMGTDAGPAESLPKLIERMQNKVPIDYGLVVRVNRADSILTVEAVYNSHAESSIRVGQKLKVDYLPAEEELWQREGIVRNNLQEFGLHPLETLLFGEGVRSYLSLPLVERDEIIGGAHFGSSKAYALNRGHLGLFVQIASALSGTIMRSRYGDSAGRFRLFTSALADEFSEAIIMCDRNRRVVEVNKAANELLDATGDVSGRKVELVLATLFEDIPATGSWIESQSDSETSATSADGRTWNIRIKSIAEDNESAGYLIVISPR